MKELQFDMTKQNLWQYDFGKKVTGYLSFRYNILEQDIVLRLSYGSVSGYMLTDKAVTLPKGSGEYRLDKYIACRYLTVEGPLEVHNVCVGFEPSQYPVKYRGDFCAGQNQLQQIWKMGARTVELCMQKNNEAGQTKFETLPPECQRFTRSWTGVYGDYVLFDGPRRDREAWLGDIRTEALVTYSAFGDYTVAKNSLMLFYDLQNEDGITYGSATTWQNFIEYNFWWIIAVWECYLYSGDMEFLQRIYPGMVKLVRYILKHADDRGFIENDGNWMWTLPREGYSSATLCVLYAALQDAVKIMTAIGEDIALVRNVQNLLPILKDNIRREFWDEERGVFRENFRFKTQQPIVALDVNCFAVIYDIADYEQSIRILRYLKENMWCDFGSTTIDKKIDFARLDPGVKHYALKPFITASSEPDKTLVSLIYPHNKKVWPFVNGYEVEARLKMNDWDNAMALIQNCWGNAAYQETDTFWEMFDIDSQKFAPRKIFEQDPTDCYNSAAHGWSGWISYIMQAEIAGIRPLDPGFKRTLIQPNIGSLQNLSSVMPTPFGDITLKIHADGAQLIVDYQAPKEIDVIFDGEKLNNENVKVIPRINKLA